MKIKPCGIRVFSFINNRADIAKMIENLIQISYTIVIDVNSG